MTDLFTSANALHRPQSLESELRPRTLDEVIGQQHILGPGKLLRRKVESGRLGSIILYGPAGTGKTSIAQAIGGIMRKEFHFLHAAHNSVADVKAVAAQARDKEILVFIDEIHRFSTTQQDSLLSLTENSVFDLCTATTGNPYHTLTAALVSRSTVFQVNPLSVEEMEEVVRRAIRYLAAKRDIHIRVAPDVLRSLAGRASGDARRAVGMMDNIVVGRAKGDAVTVDQEMVDELYQSAAMPYDRSGDAHYDVVSAFVKSMRGSDPDATLYYLARLIHSGEDPRYIARRIMIHASEDVGLADNSALSTAVAAQTAVEKIGYPEASIVLAHAALHIALAPKSNSACRGISAAMEYLKANGAMPVPPHLRDGHYKGAEKLGHTGYRFPHDDPAGWVEQVYVPGVEKGAFYVSDGRGGATFEQKASEFWSRVTGVPVPGKFNTDG